MADPLLQRIARDQQVEHERQERVREMTNAVQIAMQMRPASQVIEIQGNAQVEHLDRPDGDYAGGLTLVFRAPGADTAYRLQLKGEGIDGLHELLHSPSPETAEEAPAKDEHLTEPPSTEPELRPDPSIVG